MNDLAWRVWTTSVDVVKNFWDNRLAETYKDLVEKMKNDLQDRR